MVQSQKQGLETLKTSFKFLKHLTVLLFVYKRKLSIQLDYRQELTKLTWLPSPRVNNMKKKRIDQKGAPGILAIPSGYAMNAKPGPAKFQLITLMVSFSIGSQYPLVPRI